MNNLFYFLIPKCTAGIQNKKAGGIVLEISVIIALFLANSPWPTQVFLYWILKWSSYLVPMWLLGLLIVLETY